MVEPRRLETVGQVCQDGQVWPSRADLGAYLASGRDSGPGVGPGRSGGEKRVRPDGFDLAGRPGVVFVNQLWRPGDVRLLRAWTMPELATVDELEQIASEARSMELRRGVGVAERAYLALTCFACVRA